MRTFFLTALAILAFAPLSHGQTQKRVYQLSGLIVSKAHSEPVPFARIHVSRTRRGTVANRDGFYSIPVIEGDTIYFSSLGFKRSTLIFSDYLKHYGGDDNSAYVYVINYLEEDSIQLPDIVIFPYNTQSELRTAIVETDVPESIESVNARDNLNPEVMDVLIKGLKVDEGERVLVARQLYYNQHQQKNMLLNYLDTIQQALAPLQADTSLNAQQRIFIDHMQRTTDQLHTILAPIPPGQVALYEILPTI
ncbi:MAG: carboxypeptidase-like regulatory domain-containing protein, partial [Bacteroidota bacterium]